MKKMLVMLLIVCICLGITSLVSFAAEEIIKENIAGIQGAAYSWSGTWQNNGQDSTAGDPGSRCFDQDVGTKWGSADVANGDQWVAVKFPSAVKIDGFKIWQDAGPWTNITGFKVQIQNGTDTWVDVYTSPGFTEKWDAVEEALSATETATALRVYIPAGKAGGKSAVELTEIHIYKYNRINYGNGTGNTQKAYDASTKATLSFENTYTVASSSSGSPSNTMDGNTDTKWSSVGNSVPQWIQILLPEVKNLSGFKLYPDYNWSDITEYTVEVSTKDGWKTAYTHTGSSIEDMHEVDFDTLWNTDSIRFTVTAVGSGAQAGHGTTSIDIREINLFTAEAIPETNPTTGDASVFTLVLFVVISSVCLFKRKKIIFC